MVCTGLTFAVSHEYGVTGESLRLEYEIEIEEARCACVIAAIRVILIARLYISGDRRAYPCEVEFDRELTYFAVRSIFLLSVLYHFSVPKELESRLTVAYGHGYFFEGM